MLGPGGMYTGAERSAVADDGVSNKFRGVEFDFTASCLLQCGIPLMRKEALYEQAQRSCWG